MNPQINQITIGELIALRKLTRNKSIMIVDWKRDVKNFAINHNLTDREAVNISSSSAAFIDNLEDTK